ncbi:MAG TPA: integrase [Afipia sp.]|nr:integrase [Afipia sp.]OUX62051.1 MAG: hypothetical protein CBB64_06415 [Afipia sp. TMED4]HAP11643.1 integrase [Afipia sp.]HAQ94018.1 integrase [Afipia sp.]HBF56626.1 integrase [Afipia sp.]
MGLRMILPWENPRSRFFWFRRRVPAKFAKFGMHGEIKKSLNTTDWDEAVLLCQEENLRLERAWRENLYGTPPSDLSHEQITALAGEFYDEMVATHRANPGPPRDWEEALTKHANRKRPIVGGVSWGLHLLSTFGGEVRSFLQKRGLNLVGDQLFGFIHAYVDAKEQASKQLLKNARGDYRPDPDADRFPKFVPTDAKQVFDSLWQEFCEAKMVAASTKKKWEPYFRALIRRTGSDDMSKVTEKHLLDWRDALMASKLSKVTVRDGYIAAMKAFFGWAKRMKKLPTDPSAEVHVEVSDKHETKMRGFRDDEADRILSAALAPANKLMSKENAAARRWVPWICAYTGARVNEITQLRAKDVKEIDGIWCIHITPEAGTVKTSRERNVPLHPHLREQGFVEFARAKRGNAPLFYSIARQRNPDRKNPTYASVGNKLAEWVRGLGIKDPLVKPNHGWRHRFKTVGRKSRMDWLILDCIQGHAPRTEGEGYGEVTPDVMYREIAKHPRYKVVAKSVDGRKSKPSQLRT